MGRPLSPSVLRPMLSILAALASLAALKSLVWPRWPSVRPLDGAAIAGQLRAGGFEAVPLTPLPARRSSERGSARSAIWRPCSFNRSRSIASMRALSIGRWMAGSGAAVQRTWSMQACEARGALAAAHARRARSMAAVQPSLARRAPSAPTLPFRELLAALRL
jgi:hypothetical protein